MELQSVCSAKPMPWVWGRTSAPVHLKKGRRLECFKPVWRQSLFLQFCLVLLVAQKLHTSSSNDIIGRPNCIILCLVRRRKLLFDSNTEKRGVSISENSAKKMTTWLSVCHFHLNGNQSLFNACECLGMFAWVLHEASKLVGDILWYWWVKCKC